jgi:hypothetical protein
LALLTPKIIILALTSWKWCNFVYNEYPIPPPRTPGHPGENLSRKPGNAKKFWVSRSV